MQHRSVQSLIWQIYCIQKYVSASKGSFEIEILKSLFTVFLKNHQYQRKKNIINQSTRLFAKQQLYGLI